MVFFKVVLEVLGLGFKLVDAGFELGGPVAFCLEFGFEVVDSLVFRRELSFECGLLGF
ncbi:hypothetical protein [Haladaptatus sp. NG-WS-4]